MNDERFSRLEPMVGAVGLARLHDARVIVFGLGGVGGSCAEALVRGGAGALVLIDGDAVEASNINRQAIAFEHTLGMRKTEAAAQLVRAINPECSLELHDCFVNPDDAAGLLDALAARGRIDYIVDCIDTVGTKIALAAWAEANSVRYVGSAGTARKVDASCFEFANVYDTQVCPLCRVLRKEARKQGISRMELLYSREEPCACEAFAREGEPSALGTMSYVPPVAGMLLAGRVIRDVAFCG